MRAGAPPPESLLGPPPPPERLVEAARLFGAALLIGLLTGVTIAIFKSSVEGVAALFYNGDEVVMPWAQRAGLGSFAVIIPAIGGLGVTALRLASPRQQLGPGLAGHVAEVERSVAGRPVASLARGAASVATLGTGNALGPEGPSVELGVAISRAVGSALVGTKPPPPPAGSGGGGGGSGGSSVASPTRSGVPQWSSLQTQRQLLAAGAAAGVAAGFNAPLAGVFFSLEVISTAVRASVVPSANETAPGARAALGADAVSGGGDTALSLQQRQRGAALSLERRRDAAELDIKSKEAISATVISALVAAATVQGLLGADLALHPGEFTVRNSLIELPLYVGLGVLSGALALTFERTTCEAGDRRPRDHNPATADPATADPLCCQRAWICSDLWPTEKRVRRRIPHHQGGLATALFLSEQPRGRRE